MTRRIILGMLGLVLMLVTMSQPRVSALGLKTTPLEYKTQLKEGERKTGIIDVSNPAAQTVNVRVSVQAFKQIDDQGGLQFYDDKQIGAGIKTDLHTVELGPRQALRMPFLIDGGLLPKGDVYAAIFFTTEPKQPKNGVGQLVRVGTILSIVNQSPGERKANITALSLPFVQLGSRVEGSYRIKNTGSSNSGFYPEVKVSAWPGRPIDKVTSSLLFGGRERQNDISYDVGFGIHRVNVSYGSSMKSQWVITIAPWMVVLTGVVIVVIGVEFLLLKRRRKRSKK